MSLACLDSLVGLSKTAYTCFAGEAPDGYDTSTSGYHLTDTDYGLTVMEQCTLDGWTILSAALAQAIAETKTDLRAKLRERFNGIPPFKGLVGKLSSTGVRSESKDLIGVRLRIYKQVRGAKWVFRKIHLGMNVSEDFEVSITSNDPLFVAPDPVIIEASANAFSSTVTAIELPLWSESCPYDYLEYYITTPRNSAQPLNNTFSCCGSTPAWRSYFDAHGVSGDAIGQDAGAVSAYANGFVLDGYLACEELDWLCEAEYLNGYFAKDVLARTVQFRGAAIAISALIDTLQVSPCTGYQLEALNSRRAYLNKRFSENIAWIAENIPQGVTDCFVCKPEKTFSRSKLLV